VIRERDLGGLWWALNNYLKSFKAKSSTFLYDKWENQQITKQQFQKNLKKNEFLNNTIP